MKYSQQEVAQAINYARQVLQQVPEEQRRLFGMALTAVRAVEYGHDVSAKYPLIKEVERQLKGE